jgi:hypothetical protein
MELQEERAVAGFNEFKTRFFVAKSPVFVCI